MNSFQLMFNAFSKKATNGTTGKGQTEEKKNKINLINIKK